MLEFQASGAEDVVEGDRPVFFFGMVDSDAVVADGGVCYCRWGSEYPDDVGGGILLADDAGGFLKHVRDPRAGIGLGGGSGFWGCADKLWEGMRPNKVFG